MLGGETHNGPVVVLIFQEMAPDSQRRNEPELRTFYSQ